MSSKGKAKTVDTNDNEAPRYSIGGVAFRLLREDELTGERWDKSMPILRRLDSSGFTITACKWSELLDICSAALVACEDEMTIDAIREHLKASKDLTPPLITLIVVGFTQSNEAWLGLLDARSQAKAIMMQEVIRGAMAEATEKQSGQPKNL